jgi:hypothetical protein
MAYAYVASSSAGNASGGAVSVTTVGGADSDVLEWGAAASGANAGGAAVTMANAGVATGEAT